MWKYKDEAGEQASLHDCRATHIGLEENSVRFHFTDGFWILPGTAHNPSETARKTTASALMLHLPDHHRDWTNMEVIRTKKKSNGKTVRLVEYHNLYWLARMVGAHNAELEFVGEYRKAGGRGRLYECCLWVKKPPYHIECRMEFDMVQKIEYCWNEINPERIW